MSERDDSVSLRQMLDAAQKAIQFTRDIDFEGFKNDELKILAITRLLEILGGAARRVSQHLRSDHPDGMLYRNPHILKIPVDSAAICIVY